MLVHFIAAELRIQAGRNIRQHLFFQADTWAFAWSFADDHLHESGASSRHHGSKKLGKLFVIGYQTPDIRRTGGGLR